MALADRWSDFVSTQRAVELTNPDGVATTVNTTRLNTAASYASGDFATYVGVDYDDTDASHQAIAIQGVELYLMFGVGQLTQSQFRAARNEWIVDLRNLAKRYSEYIPDPQTDSNYTPSTPPTGRPPLDTSYWNSRRLQPPLGGGSSSSRGE